MSTTKQITLPLLLLFVILCTEVAAQEAYKTAIGVRFGYPVSISAKHFLSERMAAEAYIGTQGYSGYSTTNISGAVQMDNPFDGNLGIDEDTGLMSWYYGGGASIYFWSFDNFGFDIDSGGTSLGIQGYIGLEFTFDGAPISTSIDWIPTIFIGDAGGLSGFYGGYGTLSVRYVLNRGD